MWRRRGLSRPKADQRFRVGSVTKTLTATIVLQLVDEGKLGLSTRSKITCLVWFREATRSRSASCFSTSSGLVNYTDDYLVKGASRRRPGRSTSCASRAPSLCPSIPAPCGATRTRTTSHLVSSSSRSPGARTPTSSSNASFIRSSSTLRSFRGRGSCRISTTAALNVRTLRGGRRDRLQRTGHVSLLSALVSGRILSVPPSRTMKKTVAVGPDEAYGLGIASIGVRCGQQWGHGGWILDYITRAYANEKGDRVGVVSIYGRLADRQPDDSALVCGDYRLTASSASQNRLPPSPTTSHVTARRWQRKRRLGSGSDPAWSPDGRKMAFVSKGAIYAMNADGSASAKACAREAPPLGTQRSEDRLPQGRRHLRYEGRRQRASEARIRRRPCLVTGRAEDRVRARQRQPRRDLPGERRRRRAAN